MVSFQSNEERLKLVAATLSDEQLLNACFNASLDYATARTELLAYQRERAVRLMQERIARVTGNETPEEAATKQVDALFECFVAGGGDWVQSFGMVLRYLVDNPDWLG